MRSTRSTKKQTKVEEKPKPSPPKKGGKKAEDPEPEPKNDQKANKRTLAKSATKDPAPTKKVKKSESVDQKADDAANAMKSSKSSVKKTESKDEKKSPAKVEDKKQPAKKQAAKNDEIKKVIMKGSIPIDTYFSRAAQCKVHVDASGNIYAATLNQSNVTANNNKFYILQVLQQENNPNNFYFFTRWGRVGVCGQMAEMGPMTAANAIRQYNSKLRDKVNGGYRQVEMNYEDDEKKEEAKPEKKQKKDDQPEVQSSLDPKVQDLVRLIFDMKMMNNQMKEIGYDAKKMPLGKLAKSAILKGYEALKNLMDEVKGAKRKPLIAQYSNDFYSYIPHDFGFQHMSNFILDSEQKIKGKLEMLQSLQDIQIFTKILDQGKISNDMNELDSNYLKLGTEIKPLDPKSDTYKLLLKYVQNTHASTHTAYKLQVQQIYELSKESENKRYTKDIGNKQLLWHGSRLTNFVGILSQGLRIAPPQAPVTGYMFGKGVYFADMVTKSANYCFTNSSSNTGLMLLCEVALGDMNEKFYADYYANLLPQGKKSTKGVGRTAPVQGQTVDGVYIPCGKGVSIPVANTSLLYNEFIVYDVAQIKSKYLFRMKFNYNYR